MKSLFDTAVKEELNLRIQRLNPGSKPLWGTMNVNQNLYHMYILFEIALGKIKATPSFVPPFPKWILRLILLYLNMPKEKIKTLKEMNTIENKIDPKNFDAERDKLLRVIEDFYKSTSFAPEHSVGGRFTKSDWGKFTYKHTDYHLKQFGV